jgi:hypothetical protein
MDGGSFPEKESPRIERNGDTGAALTVPNIIAAQWGRFEQDSRGGKKIMIQQATIYVTKTDRERLAKIIESARGQNDRGNLPYVRNLEG